VKIGHMAARTLQIAFELTDDAAVARVPFMEREALQVP
jgi:hypothetical protein